MGKNTPSRQEFIISNLRVEQDLVEDEETVLDTEKTEAKEESAEAEA